MAGGRKLELGPRAVHVWRADLASVSDGLAGLLSDCERARAARFAAAADGRLWARGRGALRALLGGYLERDPRLLRFSLGARGKPALREEPTLHFNVSHSGGVALYAFTSMGPVGVDLELARRRIDAVALAARAFGSAEAARLRRLEPGRREQEFRRAWVRHEAALKRLGGGLVDPIPSAGRVGEPSIVELEMGADAAAAVALAEAPGELRCWELTEDALA